MKRIESTDNPRIKALQRMVRRGDYADRWIVEGRTLFLDALSSGIHFDEVFVTPATWQRLGSALRSDEASVFEITPALMKTISGLETPPGILGIAKRSAIPRPDVISRFAAMLVSVRDPGNMGTLARGAEASGCEFLACSPDCADPHQPKSLRASMGSLFRVPAFKIQDVKIYVEGMRARGVTVYALQPRDGRDLYQVPLKYPSLILIGGETTGVPEDVVPDDHITIPMKGRVESLNAAMAGTLCFYRFGMEQG